MYSNFLLGTLEVTEAAAARLGRTPLDLIARHAVNDYGYVTAKEAKLNAISMKHAGPIISRYMIDPTDPRQGYVEVITDESWTKTVVRLQGVP